MSIQERQIFRTESAKYLSHETIDNNFKYVANPWTIYRTYTEGMIVHNEYNGLRVWFIAIVPTTTKGTFLYPTEWETITGNDGSSGTLSTIGDPTDGSYADGYFPWVNVTTIANAFDDVNEIISQLLPAQPSLLTFLNLESSLTYFTAKMSANIPSMTNWTCYGSVAGDTLTNIVSSASLNLSLPDITTQVYGGKAATYLTDNDELYVWFKNGSVTFDGTATNELLIKDGIGNDGILSITDLVTNYNNFWLKVNAEIDLTLVAGYNQVKLTGDVSGDSNVYRAYYTGAYPAPTVNSYNCVINTPSYMYLSGVTYYNTGTTFNLSYTINNLYNPVYSVENQSQVTSTHHTTANDNYGGIPDYNSQLIITNKVLTLLASKNSGTALGTGLITVNKPSLSNVTQSYNLGTRPINSMGTVSTTTHEYFFDENKRYLTYAMTAWVSSTAFTNTYGQLEVQNGKLIDPRFSGNYPSYTSTTNYYYRQFSGFTVTDKGQLTITKNGFATGSLGPWNTSGGTKLQLALYVSRAGIWTQYDMGLGIGLPQVDGGKGILDTGQSTDTIIKWAFTTENLTAPDIAILAIKYTSALVTDYMTDLVMDWTWT